MMQLSLSLLLALPLVFAVNDVDILPWISPIPPGPGLRNPLNLQQDTNSNLKTKRWSSKTPSTYRPFTAYLASTDDSSLFSFVMPQNGCSKRNTPSDTAKIFGCQVATNGGFFNFAGSCEGNSIIDGRIDHWDQANRVTFG